MRRLVATKQFYRDSKKNLKYIITAEWIDVLYRLLTDTPLPEKYKDHPLTGNWLGFMDCHIKPDLVLIYRKVPNDELQLIRLGSHSELGL